MTKPKGRPTTREKRSQLAQLDSHRHGTEKGAKWPMAIKDGSRDDSGSVANTGLRGTSNDADLEKIQRSLDSDKNLRGYGLKASYSNNTLQITGVVDTLAEKLSLKELMVQHGIQKYADAVGLSTDGQVLDNHVALEVREELKADSDLQELDISVQCVAGTVFLVGDIQSRRQEELAVTAARRARGVTRVVSQLKYLPGDMDLESIFHAQVNNDREWNSPKGK